jgi:hypothetical protein
LTCRCAAFPQHFPLVTTSNWTACGGASPLAGHSGARALHPPTEATSVAPDSWSDSETSRGLRRAGRRLGAKMMRHQAPRPTGMVAGSGSGWPQALQNRQPSLRSPLRAVTSRWWGSCLRGRRKPRMRRGPRLADLGRASHANGRRSPSRSLVRPAASDELRLSGHTSDQTTVIGAIFASAAQGTRNARKQLLCQIQEKAGHLAINCHLSSRYKIHILLHYIKIKTI